jgi:hypothetical protein
MREEARSSTGGLASLLLADRREVRPAEEGPFRDKAMRTGEGNQQIPRNFLLNN